MLKEILVIFAVSLFLVPVSMPLDHAGAGINLGFENSPAMNVTLDNSNISLNWFNPYFLKFDSNIGIANIYPHLKWTMRENGKLNYSYTTNASVPIGNIPSPFTGSRASGILSLDEEYQNISVNIDKSTSSLNLTGSNGTSLIINGTNTLSVSYSINIHEPIISSGVFVIPMVFYQGRGFRNAINERFVERASLRELKGLMMPMENSTQSFIFSMGTRYLDNGRTMNSTVEYMHYGRFYMFYLLMPYSGAYNNISYDPYITFPASIPLRSITVSTPVTEAIGEVESNIYAFAGGAILGVLLIGSGYVSYRKRNA